MKVTHGNSNVHSGTSHTLMMIMMTFQVILDSLLSFIHSFIHLPKTHHIEQMIKAVDEQEQQDRDIGLSLLTGISNST